MKKIIITIAIAVICAINVNAQNVDFTKNMFFKSICESYLQYKECVEEELDSAADKIAVSMAKFYLLGTERHKNAFLSLDSENPAVMEKLKGISSEILNIMKIVENFDNYSEDGKKGASLLWEEYENNIDSIEDELYSIVCKN